jgi:hypothetical protein
MKFYIITALLALSAILISAAPTENRKLSRQIAFKLLRDQILRSVKENVVTDSTFFEFAVSDTDLKCIEEKLHTSLDVDVTEDDEVEFLSNGRRYVEDMLMLYMATILCPPGRTQGFEKKFVTFANEHHTGVLKEMNCKPGCYKNQLKELDPESVLVADAQPEENCAECIKKTDNYMNTKFDSIMLFHEDCRKPLIEMFQTNYYSVVMLRLGEFSDEVKQTVMERLNNNSLETTHNTLDCLVSKGE